jgi:hypothetical protein
MRPWLLMVAALAGCTPNPYCFTCYETAQPDLAEPIVDTPDLAEPPDLTGPCRQTNGGVEICDNLDNDCNGAVDDVDLPQLASDPNNCGACGRVCNFQGQHQFGSCENGLCVATTCMPGFVDIDSRAPGCEYGCTPTVPPTEVCDGRDNDCNGAIDDGLTPPASMTCANQGVCAGVSIPVVCKGIAGWHCDYSAVPGISLDSVGALSVIEPTCDNLDNNCNGIVDKDGFSSVGKPCAAGTGVCQNVGSIVCSTTTTVGCSASAAPGRAVDEECNGLDDNCDGQVDERDPAMPTNCDDGSGGTRLCRGWRDPMVAVPTGASYVYVYRYEASRPDSTATSPGGRSTRACSKPGVLPWASVTKTGAEAACAQVLDSTGASMRLCTAAEWQIGCEGPGGPPSSGSKWSTSPTPSTSPPGVCNDDRAAGRAVLATGSGANCYSDWKPSGDDRLYDLSGNLVEWTATPVTAEGTTYFQARGGSYSSPVNGTACENDIVIYPPTFVNTNLGFRCCSDNPP